MEFLLLRLGEGDEGTRPQAAQQRDNREAVELGRHLEYVASAEWLFGILPALCEENQRPDESEQGSADSD